MSHSIRFVGSEVLPEGHDFMTIEFPGGFLVLIRETSLKEATFEGAWAAYRALGGRAKPGPPVRMVHPMLKTA